MHPKFSIIVPVYHEGEKINDFIEHLDRIELKNHCEIIIVDVGEKQDTLSVIQSQKVVRISSKKGRAKQMNAGASIAKGDILVFLHADTELPSHALPLIDAVLKKEGYVGGAFDLGIRSDKRIYKVIAFMASFRSRLNKIPYGDQAFFFRKEYFTRIGRFKEMPLMEDVELMRRIKKSGDKIWILPERVMTSARRWEKEGVIYCTLRNWTLFILYLLGFSPDKLVKFYRSDDHR